MAKVLVVDDSEMQRNNIKDIIVQRGHDVITAANGQEGIDCYQSDKVDLILADHNMPILTGLKCVRRFMRFLVDLLLPL